MSHDIIIEAVAYLIENAFFFFIISRLFRPKYNVLITIATVLAKTAVDCFTFNLSIWLRSPISVIVCVLLCMIIYSTKPYIISALCIMFGYIVSIVNLLIGILLSICFNKYILIIFRGISAQHVIAHILTDIVVIAILFYFVNILKKKSFDSAPQFWKIFNILMVTFFLIAVMFMTAYPVTSPSSVAERIYAITTAMFFVLTIIITHMSIVISDKLRQADKFRTISDSFESLEEAYYVQLDAITATRKMRHDMRAHASSIISLMKQNKIDEAMTMMDEIYTHLELPLARIDKLTGNIYVDIILTNKLTMLRKHDINCEYELDSLKNSNIENIDITSVVSNLLDNAYEAASVSKEKYIKFQLMDYDSHVFIRTLNSYAVEPVESSIRGRILSSTKKDPGIHGLGMEIISDIADKYNGSFIWEIHDGLFDAYVTMAKDVYGSDESAK